MVFRKTSYISVSIVVLFTLLGAASVWAAGGKEATGSQVTTIKFWKAPHSPSEAEYWQPVLDKFQQAHPNIKVDYLVTPWDTWIEKYTAAFAGGDPPDVSYMTEWYPRFADAGQLADLQPHITTEIRNRYGTGPWQYATYHGKVIGIPFIALDSVFYYNKTIFEKEGIKVPQTCEELRVAAKKATRDLNGDGKTDQWGMVFDLTPTLDIHQFAPFIIQSGASYLDSSQKALGFDNPEGIRGIRFVTDLIVKDHVAPPIDMYDTTQSADLFYKGKVAMYFGQLSFRNEVKKNAPGLDLGSFVAPAGPATNPELARANYGAIGLMSMAAASKHPDAAWTFIDFITKPENERLYLSKVGFLSPNPATNKLMYPDDSFMQIASAATKNMVGYPVVSAWPKIDTIMKRMVEEILRGTKTVEGAVTSANQQAKQALE